MAGPVITSKPRAWLPWLGASLAMHGLVFYGLWAQMAPPPAMPSSTMEVDIVSIADAGAPMRAEPARPAGQMTLARDDPGASLRPQVMSIPSPARQKAQALSTQTAVAKRHTAKPISQATALKAAKPLPRKHPQASTALATLQTQDLAHHRALVRQRLEACKHYPASARRRGITGVVEVAFNLDVGGHANTVSILAGSGYAILDRAALLTVDRAQPFPVSGGSYRFRLRFHRL